MDFFVRVQVIENLGKWNIEIIKFMEYVLYSGFIREKGKSVVWNFWFFRYCFYMVFVFIIFIIKVFFNNQIFVFGEKIQVLCLYIIFKKYVCYIICLIMLLIK